MGLDSQKKKNYVHNRFLAANVLTSHGKGCRWLSVHVPIFFGFPVPRQHTDTL